MQPITYFPLKWETCKFEPDPRSSLLLSLDTDWIVSWLPSKQCTEAEEGTYKWEWVHCNLATLMNLCVSETGKGPIWEEAANVKVVPLPNWSVLDKQILSCTLQWQKLISMTVKPMWGDNGGPSMDSPIWSAPKKAKEKAAWTSFTSKLDQHILRRMPLSALVFLW